MGVKETRYTWEDNVILEKIYSGGKRLHSKTARRDMWH